MLYCITAGVILASPEWVEPIVFWPITYSFRFPPYHKQHLSGRVSIRRAIHVAPPTLTCVSTVLRVSVRRAWSRWQHLPWRMSPASCEPNPPRDPGGSTYLDVRLDRLAEDDVEAVWPGLCLVGNRDGWQQRGVLTGRAVVGRVEGINLQVTCTAHQGALTVVSRWSPKLID